jgi:hypothetical protein
MPKMQKIPNLLLLISRDHQLVYFTMLSPKKLGFMLDILLKDDCLSFQVWSVYV